MALLPTHEYLNSFRDQLFAKMAQNGPKTDAEIEAQYGADDQPEDEN